MLAFSLDDVMRDFVEEPVIAFHGFSEIFFKLKHFRFNGSLYVVYDCHDSVSNVIRGDNGNQKFERKFSISLYVEKKML